ncbi:MAG: sulfite exporter TauE/SafE family protein [Mariniphaga sp.]|nr:sulfite exporter TauE/SafE family protein [Mariniphaga sp.]
MEQSFLIITAASLGFLHTLLGPDHYVPFIAISKARNWDIKKTISITVLCGIGHVLGSIVLGLIGVFSGIALTSIEYIESFRGSVAAWLLIGFGLVYMIYGIRKAYRNKPHKHVHFHEDGVIHEHQHNHKTGHVHVHEKQGKKKITPWVLFIIFVFGPCEVLIPLLMYPAAKGNYSVLIISTLVFALTTIITMTGVVLISLVGFKFIQVKKFERYVHAIAGMLILICGIAVEFLGI